MIFIINFLDNFEFIYPRLCRIHSCFCANEVLEPLGRVKSPKRCSSRSQFFSQVAE